MCERVYRYFDEEKYANEMCEGKFRIGNILYYKYCVGETRKDEKEGTIEHEGSHGQELSNRTFILCCSTLPDLKCYGKYKVEIEVEKFLRRCEECGYICIEHRKVKYDVSESERCQSTDSYWRDLGFYKESEYKEEKEYRFKFTPANFLVGVEIDFVERFLERGFSFANVGFDRLDMNRIKSELDRYNELGLFNNKNERRAINYSMFSLNMILNELKKRVEENVCYYYVNIGGGDNGISRI